ncbi:oligosaccharide flippase family protein [Bradyrhizobium sp. LTSPM299]|uniref:oligosaccharide flippase family protein n=1 Tax=Bradyrhizobium sp. LTSPM299 TaxID=1619233 RepID=UPI000B25BE83|nr:oligosaccharide flippase family protein [Bradyrhizobium sp. LTSPM299]
MIALVGATQLAMIGALLRVAGWLGVIQLANYVLAVVTLLVVTRAFGPSIFGTLATISALAAYVGLVVTFGLNLSGPRLVVRLRDSPDELSNALSTVACMQVLLGTMAAAGFMLVVSIVSPGSEYTLISAFIVLQACLTAITPDWAFLGLERMRDFAILQVVGRVLTTVCTVMFIHTSSDVLLYVEINAFAAAGIAVASIGVLRTKGIYWRAPKLEAIWQTIHDAAANFLSTASINLYTSTGVVIVNFILGPAAAGPFALADRLRNVVGNVTLPIITAIYPFVCRIAATPEAAEDEAWTKRIFFQGTLGLSAALSLGLFVFAPTIISLAGGAAFAEAVPILRILAAVPFLIALSNILGIQTMMPLGMDWHAMWIFATTAAIGVIGMFVSTDLFGLRGSAFSVLAIEVFVTITMIVVLQRRIDVLSLFINLQTWKE